MAKAIREIYGETLAELGNTMKNLVVLDADVAGSTKSAIFGKAHPDRFFDMGIAEANMAATAAGMATTGLVPFINTFAVFVTSASLVALRGQICYGNLNVKLGGAYAGMSDARDGATHHALEDLAVTRSLPNMRILSVCDAAETRWATRTAAELEGPVYIRLSREAMPDLYAPDHVFTFGKAETLREERTPRSSPRACLSTTLWRRRSSWRRREYLSACWICIPSSRWTLKRSWQRLTAVPSSR